MESEYNFNFPESWDRDNHLAVRLYERCASKFDNVDDFKFIYTKSTFYHIMVWFLIAYNIFSIILILSNKNSFDKLKLNKTILLIYTFSGLICIINCYLRNIFFESIPCSIVVYFFNLGYIPNILASIGCIMYYLQQCYITLNSYNKAINKSIKRTGFVYNICLKFKEESFIKFILICTIGSVLFSGILGVFGTTYTYVPLSRGYCTTSSVEGYPLYVSLAAYFVFSIFALIELHRLGRDFIFRKSLIITLYIVVLLLILNVLGNGTDYVKCTKIIRYIPNDSLLHIFSCIYNISQITIPILQLNYNKYKVKKLDLTKKGLIHLLNDSALFDEYLNFCNEKRCVEGVVFHREYKKFKNLFKAGNKKLANVIITVNSNNSGNCVINIDPPHEEQQQQQQPINISKEFLLPPEIEKTSYSPSDTSSISSHPSSAPTSPTSPKLIIRHTSTERKKKEFVSIYNCENDSDDDDSDDDGDDIDSNRTSETYHVIDKKLVQIYDEIHEKINSIYKFFFAHRSDYELNVPGPIVKNVRKRLKIFNHSYKKMKSYQPFTYEELDCEDIFDETYEEVMQSLYLNTYSAFVVHKRKQK